jgi:hypothetical protein
MVSLHWNQQGIPSHWFECDLAPFFGTIDAAMHPSNAENHEKQWEFECKYQVTYQGLDLWEDNEFLNAPFQVLKHLKT